MDRQLAFSEACSGKLKKVPVSLSSVRLSWWFCLVSSGVGLGDRRGSADDPTKASGAWLTRHR